MRDRLRELQDKRQAARREPNSTNTWTTAGRQEFAEIRDKSSRIRQPAGQSAIAETAIVRITLATNAEPGERDLRLETPAGLSNPLISASGNCRNFPGGGKGRQPGPGSLPGKTGQNTRHQHGVRDEHHAAGRRQWADHARRRGLVPVQARKGQRLVVAVSARELIPYLADAVPGWFQVAVSLHDAQGRN